MASKELLNIINQLDSIGSKPIPRQEGFMAFCPAHNDVNNRSLSLNDSTDPSHKGISLYCFNACTFHDIVAAIGLPYQDFFYEKKQKRSKPQNAKKQSVKKDTVKDKEDPRSTKKEYNNLIDYAAFQGFPVEIFTAKGWEDYLYQGKYKAARIFTKGGYRYRLFTNSGNKFATDTEPKFQKCWYLLDEAIEIAKKNNQSLVLCNGESSTVIAQHLNLPVFAICASESARLEKETELLNELKSKWQGSILIPVDNDDTGHKGGLIRQQALIQAGFHVRLVEFESDMKGYDLANFCKDNKDLVLESETKLYDKFIKLKDFDPKLENDTKQASTKLESQLANTLHDEGLDNFSDTFASYFTETNAGYRFVAQHHTFVRYCHPWKKWLFWDGKKWIQDNVGEMIRRALFTVLSILEEAKNLPANTKRQKTKRKLMLKQGVHFQNIGKLENMLKVARNAGSIYVLPEQFDNDPWLLNCQNGLLNLKTGELTPHNSNIYLTKICSTDYDPNATCPIWLKFLDKIMDGNQNLVNFLQKAIGHSLTGTTMEKALFFFYGQVGDNGKSTFLETISTLMGSYALPKFPIGALLDDRQNSTSNNPAPHIAQLAGVRFATASELSGNKKLNEETVKDLTGGIDSISAKRLYENPFTFKPTHKLFIYGNDRPHIDSSSKAMWNRLKTIPFLVSIPPEEQDRDLPNKLLKEMPGILAWAVRGCLEWQKTGLGMPEEVKQANEDYREEMDRTQHFIDECCVIDQNAQVGATDLYKKYWEWCKSAFIQFPYSQTRFGNELTAKNFHRKKGSRGYMFWLGIDLNPLSKPVTQEQVNELNQALNDQFKNKKK